jgi:hypothetical protein
MAQQPRHRSLTPHAGIAVIASVLGVAVGGTVEVLHDRPVLGGGAVAVAAMLATLFAVADVDRAMKNDPLLRCARVAFIAFTVWTAVGVALAHNLSWAWGVPLGLILGLYLIRQTSREA